MQQIFCIVVMVIICCLFYFSTRMIRDILFSGLMLIYVGGVIYLWWGSQDWVCSLCYNMPPQGFIYGQKWGICLTVVHWELLKGETVLIKLQHNEVLYIIQFHFYRLFFSYRKRQQCLLRKGQLEASLERLKSKSAFATQFTSVMWCISKLKGIFDEIS